MSFSENKFMEFRIAEKEAQIEKLKLEVSWLKKCLTVIKQNAESRAKEIGKILKKRNWGEGSK